MHLLLIEARVAKEIFFVDREIFSLSTFFFRQEFFFTERKIYLWLIGESPNDTQKNDVSSTGIETWLPSPRRFACCGVKRRKKNIFRSGEIVDVYKTCWYSIFFCSASVCAHYDFVLLLYVSILSLKLFFNACWILDFYSLYILSTWWRQEKKNLFWESLKLTDNLIEATYSV